MKSTLRRSLLHSQRSAHRVGVGSGEGGYGRRGGSVLFFFLPLSLSFFLSLPFFSRKEGRGHSFSIPLFMMLEFTHHDLMS